MRCDTFSRRFWFSWALLFLVTIGTRVRAAVNLAPSCTLLIQPLGGSESLSNTLQIEVKCRWVPGTCWIVHTCSG
jgi:hypothetical protein